MFFDRKLLVEKANFFLANTENKDSAITIIEQGIIPTLGSGLDIHYWEEVIEIIKEFKCL